MSGHGHCDAGGSATCGGRHRTLGGSDGRAPGTPEVLEVHERACVAGCGNTTVCGSECLRVVQTILLHTYEFCWQSTVTAACRDVCRRLCLFVIAGGIIDKLTIEVSPVVLFNTLTVLRPSPFSTMDRSLSDSSLDCLSSTPY